MINTNPEASITPFLVAAVIFIGLAQFVTLLMIQDVSHDVDRVHTRVERASHEADLTRTYHIAPIDDRIDAVRREVLDALGETRNICRNAGYR